MHWTLGSSDGLMSRAESAENTCGAGRTGTTPAEPEMKATCAAKPETVWFQSPEADPCSPDSHPLKCSQFSA